MVRLQKLTLDVDGFEVPQAPPAVFEQRPTDSGMERLLIDVPEAHSDLIVRLVELLPPPYYILYVLHTPRGEGEAGRYQSTELSWQETRSFLNKYENYFASDARHDLWVYAPATAQTLVWDRHNRLFVEGQPLAAMVEALKHLGFAEGEVPSLGAHYHHYRAEYDDDAAAILQEFDWLRTPLRSEDAQ